MPPTVSSVEYRHSKTMLALEPRMLFDGAAAVTGDIVPDDFEPLPPLVDPGGDPVFISGEAPRIIGGDQPVQALAGEPVVFTAAVNDSLATGIGEQLAVADPDGPQPPGDYRLTIAAFHGNVRVTESGDALYGNDSTHITIWGSIDELNEALTGLQYTPDSAFRGETVLRLEVIEPSGRGDAHQVELVVSDPNRAPIAADDRRVLGTARGEIQGNVIDGVAPGDERDFDPDGDLIGVFGVLAGATVHVPLVGVSEPIAGRYGVLTLDQDGGYRYQPTVKAGELAAGETVVDEFSYLICDPAGAIDTAVLRLELRGGSDTGEPGGPATPGDPSTPADPGNPDVPTTPAIPGTPITVAPPIAQPMFSVPGPAFSPLLNTANNPLFGNPVGGPNLGNGPQVKSLSAIPAAAVSAAPLLLQPDTSSPFAPTAVLGQIELERERDRERIRRLTEAPVAPDEDCEPIKPKVVKRSVLADSGVVAPKPKAFSQQLEQAGKRIKPPVTTRQMSGRDC